MLRSATPDPVALPLRLMNLAVLLFGLLLPPLQRTCPAQELEWAELRSPSFAVIFPEEAAELAQLLFAAYGGALEEEYARLARLFQTDLTLPISLRIYPDMPAFECLNAVNLPVDPTRSHLHLGSREIAFIASNLHIDPFGFQNVSLNDLRYEMAILFVERITDGKAPPGLAEGVGIYALEPGLGSGPEELLNNGNPGPLSAWAYLWNDPETAADPWRSVQAGSSVAFLVDVYGWEFFIDFLERLRTAPGYRQALAATYDRPAAELEAQWQQYLTQYLAGRWRANALYEFDLSPFEELLRAGAYEAAAESLDEAIRFLEQIGDEAQLARAQQLIYLALHGQEAGARVREARQALLDGDHAGAIALAETARDKYLELGDERRLTEIQLYQDTAEEILALRAELGQLSAEVAAGATDPTDRLIELGGRLGELGDTGSVEQTNQLLEQLAERQRSALEPDSQDTSRSYLLAGLLAVALIMGHRLWALRRGLPPERRLL